MELANIVHRWSEALAWPAVAVLALLLYRKILAELVQGSKIKLTISGISIETTLPVLEQSVTESLGGRKLTEDQLSLLRQLRDEGRSPFDKGKIDTVRPLRNAGLLRFHPDGPGRFLQNAEEVEITTLGRLLIDADEKG